MTGLMQKHGKAMNNSTLIKICGIKDALMLEHVIETGADLVGFMHFAKSPRHAGKEQIGRLIEMTSGKIRSVVVLVNPDRKTLKDIMELEPDFIQLHGNESPDWIADNFDAPDQMVIKALPIGSRADLEAIGMFGGLVRHILLDARPPEQANRPGGLGETFEWELLDALDGNQEFFLGGGLNPGNVRQAISRVKPRGIDVSSGVESSLGIKDAGLITKFVTNARQADKNRTRDR